MPLFGFQDVADEVLKGWHVAEDDFEIGQLRGKSHLTAAKKERKERKYYYTALRGPSEGLYRC